MFSSRLPLKALIEFCRSIRHMVEAGLTLAKAMTQQGKKGPLPVRPVAARMGARMTKGEDFATVLQEEERFFPPLFLSLSSVGEDTGKLPEALRELEEFFRLQLKLKKEFISQITWPLTQYVLAILVIALLIWILGVVAPAGAKPPITVFGLYGGSGAQLFLAIVLAFHAALLGLYWFVRAVLNMGPAVDRFLLRIPALGPMLEALALCRFSMSMGLTVEAGTPIADAVRLSLNATSNGAYADRVDAAVAMIRGGETLAQALREQNLFPEEYIDIVETAEVSGNEPEVFHRLAEQNNETATIRMKVLTNAAAWTVWVLVAIFIIIMIFQLYSQYIGAINQIG
jgi:type IV pilus assembly protein PilC